MTKNTHTDPMESLLEGPMDWARQKFSKGPEVVDSSVDLSNVKDVTPDPSKEALRALISAYNSADLVAQFKFIEKLVQYDGEKVKEIQAKLANKGL